MSTTPDANKEVVQRAFDAWDEGDTDAFDEVYAEDVVHRDSDLGGVEDLRWLMPVWFEAFPDLDHTVEAMIAEDDWVVTRFTISGTHEREFRGIEVPGE